jgi:hypothetical protein
VEKADLERKHIAELHALAAERGVPGYRMLGRGELVAARAGGVGADEESAAQPRERPRRRERGGREERRPPAPEPQAREPQEGRPRRRRRRRFGRRGRKGVQLPDLLLPPAGGRQAVVFAETREGCTQLLRSVAAELSHASKGPDPVVLLIDPSPEELAEWKREAPQAELVSAGQPRHADDALAQAVGRARSGEDIMLLVDSLTRLAEAHGDGEAAKDFFDSGRGLGDSASGTLTVVAAFERQS